MPVENDKRKGPIHDPFVIKEMMDLPQARSLFQQYLPPKSSTRVQWNKLQVFASRLVDEELRSNYPDILFSAEWDTGEPVLFYLLFEHKSWIDPQTLLQLLRGMLSAWEAFLKANPGSPILLPFIFPFVLYHGKSDWTVSTQFADLISIPEGLKEELSRHAPHFEHMLLDLHKTRIEEMRGTVELRLVLALLKAVSEGREAEWIERVFNPMLKLIQQTDTVGFVRGLFTYLIRASGVVTASTFWELADRIPEENTKTAIMTLAEKLFEEGRQEGWQKGREDGQRAALLKLLEVRFGEIPFQTQEKIQQLQNEASISLAMERLVAAKTLEDFLVTL
jgi:hypothetical protein